jgi:alanine racemase
MDMLMVSLGRPDGPGAAVRLGDPAVLFGPGGPTAEEAAAAAGTISYELTSGLTERVAHVYTGA